MSNSSSDRRTGLSWQKKCVFASITTASFFLLLELGLGLMGVEPAAETSDPMVGFSGQIPLLELEQDETGEAIARTAKGKLVWFNPQSFPARKPANTRRVFCLGGSTTYGRPFDDLTSYCGWLRELLPLVDDSSRWEVINAGGVSYASYRVARVMEELAHYQPDLFIVYSAHNEFLERRTYQGVFESSPWRRDTSSVLQKTRLGSLVAGLLSSRRSASPSPVVRLPAEVDEILNHSVGPRDYVRDDGWHEDVLRHFEFNLRRMVSIARKSGAEIVFVMPACNLRDCRPFKTEIAQQLGEDDAAEVRRQLGMVASMLDNDRFDQALETSNRLLATDPRNAEAHFYAGSALFGLGRYAQAEAALGRAIDEDVCPLRATSTVTETIRRVAKEKGVTIVDFEQQLDSRSRRELGHGCFGSEYFYDHVHPTIDVHRDLALWILAALQRESWVGGAAPGPADLAQLQRRIDGQIDAHAQGVAFRNLAKVMHWAGRFDEAAHSASNAIRLIPDDLESRFVLADCLASKGRDDQALAQFEQLLALGDYPRAYVPVAELLIERRRWQEAKSYLIPALISEQPRHRARVYYLLGGVHLRLGEHQYALELLSELNKLTEDDPATLLMLAEAYAGVDDAKAALEVLRRVIELDKDNAEAYFRLGVALIEQNQLDVARRHLESAIKLAPTDERATAALQKIRELDAVPIFK